MVDDLQISSALFLSHTEWGKGEGPIGSVCSWSGCTLKPDPGVVDKTGGVILYIVPGGGGGGG